MKVSTFYEGQLLRRAFGSIGLRTYHLCLMRINPRHVTMRVGEFEVGCELEE
ncbi:hypothetical protein [Variovorax fucosicus]|uniref:hypothetical protein n=1 Tax=Variovorax fucosicus TaxID=3053517 RepID=UPI0025788468|nr:hypothetical protein [Variovorax sp. J22G47]MDM0054995.1 hypothetical protein [Variovorax sp. J22G47]